MSTGATGVGSSPKASTRWAVAIALMFALLASLDLVVVFVYPWLDFNFG